MYSVVKQEPVSLEDALKVLDLLRKGASQQCGRGACDQIDYVATALRNGSISIDEAIERGWQLVGGDSSCN